MRVSQNEVYRVAQRALESAGAPHGVDRDGAQAVAWLEGRGLPGLAMLAAALDRLDGAFVPLSPWDRQGGAAAIDLAGRPSIAWAGAMLDCLELVLRADDQAVLRLRNCRWPLFLLPQAVHQAGRGRPIRLRWQVGPTRLTCVAEPGGGCRIVAEGDATAGDGVLRGEGPVEVLLNAAGGGARGADRDAPARVLDAAMLDQALQRSLADGIVVDDPVWDRVVAAARRVLVPASDESRARGAGGGDANS